MSFIFFAKLNINMKKTVKSILAPIFSLIVLVLGNGLFLTYTTIRLKIDNYSDVIIGIISSAYYAGMFLGALFTSKLIEKIGYIKSFIIFSTLLSVFCLLQGFFINAYIWSILRILNGAMMAGLFITIESWLLIKSNLKNRGKVLATYMIALYASQSLGQFLLNVSNPLSFTPYILVSSLSIISILPIVISNNQVPVTHEPSYLKLFKLLKISPLGVIGCSLSGLLLGTIYSLNPIYAKAIGLNLQEVALFMSLTIFGGLVLQWPIGHLSDYIDRRKVLCIVSILTIGVSILIAILNDYNLYLLFGLIFLFGGLSFTLYPICISHTCDQLDPKDFVAGTGVLVLAYGVGAIIGPLVAPFSITLFGYRGLFIYFSLISALLALYSFIRLIKTSPIPEEDKLPYSNLPRTTPIVGELDPRSDEANKKN
jgi:MFS family permease